MKCMQKCCSCIPQRYILCIFIVTGFITLYLMRTCVFLAINEMTVRINKTTAAGVYCPDYPRSQKSQDRAEFNWNQKLQHDIIKSIYVGYILAHLPAGVLADTFGGKHVLGAGVLVSSILSISFPFLARFSPYAFMAGRVVQGLGQGVMFPASSSLLSKWAPPNERATMNGIVQSGIMIGHGSAYAVSGIILDAFPGWEPIFYLCGTLGLIWSVGWYTMVSSTPASHAFITDKEREMITSQISAKEKPKHIPWKAILTCPAVISAIMINFGHAWGVLTMVNELPVYMYKVLNYDIKSSGFGAAAPNLAMLPSALGSGFVYDWLVRKGYMTITTNRKTFAFLSNTLPLPFLLAASFAECDRLLVIFFFMCMMFFKGMAYPSVRSNPVDLTPTYSGIIMALMNGVGSFAGLLSPMVVPLFITGDGSVQEWRNVWITTSIVMAVLSVPYLCFGSGEVQSWNFVEPPPPSPETETNDEKETEEVDKKNVKA